jgi:flagellar basal body rod protein FlgB
LAAANGGNAPPHGGTGHNQTLDDHIKILQQTDGVTNIRKNQQQVDANGNRVRTNRPDIQYDQNNVHYNVEFDTSSKGSANHQTRVTANDPNARSTFWEIDGNGNKITGRSAC